jgi:hypothetical protein
LSIVVTPAESAPPLQSVVVNYGDGASDDLGAVSGTVTVPHIYNEGTYTATVSATDVAGSSASASTVVIVQPLLVSISATNTGKTFNFTANVSPASVPIASYVWTFDDGTGGTTTGAGATTHTYAAGVTGTRTVRLTVRTATNRTASGSVNVTVP